MLTRYQQIDIIRGMAKKMKSTAEQIREAIIASGMNRFGLSNASGLPYATCHRFMAGADATTATIDRMLAAVGLRILIERK